MMVLAMKMILMRTLQRMNKKRVEDFTDLFMDSTEDK